MTVTLFQEVVRTPARLQTSVRAGGKVAVVLLSVMQNTTFMLPALYRETCEI